MDIKEEQIRKIIRDRVADMLEIEPEEIDFDDPLLDYMLDSFMALDLIAELENAYDIKIPPEDYKRFKSVNDVAELIKERGKC